MSVRIGSVPTSAPKSVDPDASDNLKITCAIAMSHLEEGPETFGHTAPAPTGHKWVRMVPLPHAHDALSEQLQKGKHTYTSKELETLGLRATAYARESYAHSCQKRDAEDYGLHATPCESAAGNGFELGHCGAWAEFKFPPDKPKPFELQRHHCVVTPKGVFRPVVEPPNLCLTRPVNNKRLWPHGVSLRGAEPLAQTGAFWLPEEMPFSLLPGSTVELYAAGMRGALCSWDAERGTFIVKGPWFLLHVRGEDTARFLQAACDVHLFPTTLHLVDFYNSLRPAAHDKQVHGALDAAYMTTDAHGLPEEMPFASLPGGTVELYAAKMGANALFDVQRGTFIVKRPEFVLHVRSEDTARFLQAACDVHCFPTTLRLVDFYNSLRPVVCDQQVCEELNRKTHMKRSLKRRRDELTAIVNSAAHASAEVGRLHAKLRGVARDATAAASS